MGTTQSGFSKAKVAYVAYSTGDDSNGVLQNVLGTIVSSDAPYVFRTVDSAYEAFVTSGLLDDRDVWCGIAIFYDTANKPVVNDGPQFQVLNKGNYRNITIGAYPGINISQNDRPWLYISKDTTFSDSLLINVSIVNFESNSYSTDGNDVNYLGSVNALIMKGSSRYENLTFDNRYYFTGVYHTNDPLFVPPTFTEPPLQSTLSSRLLGNSSETPNVINDGVLTFENVSFANEAENAIMPSCLIENKGELTGEFPELVFPNSPNDENASTTLINNNAGAKVDFDNNNVTRNRKIISNYDIVLVNTTEAGNDGDVRLENIELDLNVPDKGALFTITPTPLLRGLKSFKGAPLLSTTRPFSLVRCNFKSENILLLTSTTQYTCIDCVTRNVMIPTCRKDISNMTSSYSDHCTEMRPDITAKINGGTIANSSVIIPAKKLADYTEITDIFENDSSIYYLDAACGKFDVILPSNPINGYILTFKKMDHSENRVRIRSSAKIEGRCHLTLKSCSKTHKSMVKLHFFDGTYYILSGY